MLEGKQLELLDTLLHGYMAKASVTEQVEIKTCKDQLDKLLAKLDKEHEADIVLFAGAMFALDVFARLEEV